MFIEIIYIVTIALAIAGTWFATSLVRLIRHEGAVVGWVTVLPVVFIYAFVLRIVQFLIYLGILEDPLLLVPALYCIFYAGLVLFIYGMYKGVKNLLDRVIIQCL